jgi:PAS domain S-box-containing protein
MGQRESWETRDSGAVPLPPSRRRARVSEITTGELDRRELRRSILEATGPKPASLTDLSAITTALARELDPTADEEEQLAIALAHWTSHLPGRLFVVRLVDREARAVDLVRTTATLVREAEHVRVTTAALERAGLDVARASELGIDVVSEYESDFFIGSSGSAADFAIGAEGCDACLVVDGSLLGVVGLEVATAHPLPPGDPELLDVLASQLAATLQRARVRHEASYLSGYLSRLLDHAHAPIAVVDRTHRVRVASQAWLTLLQRSRDELVGQELHRFVLPEHRETTRAAIDATLRDAAPSAPIDLGLPRGEGAPPNDATVHLLAHLVPIVSREGEVEGALVLGRDVTELRALESQVRHAERLATLGQLAAGVVHELNNPLTSIAIYSDFLHAKWAREAHALEDREKLQRIRQAAERVLRFSRDLVSYARPATDERASPLELHDSIEQSLAFCEHVIADAGVEVERRLAAAQTRVLGVASQLHQVFINLVTNACHAMPRGEGRLVVESDTRDGRVHVRLRDNGAGIPEEHLARIFEPFFSTKHAGEGTGLGLSIARRIVDHHGGELQATSELGVGTTFELVLPLHDDSSSSAPSPR